MKRCPKRGAEAPNVAVICMDCGTRNDSYKDYPLFVYPGRTFQARVFTSHSPKYRVQDYSYKNGPYKGKAVVPITLTEDDLRCGFRQEIPITPEDGSLCVVTLSISRHLSFWQVILHGIP